ncbi:MAG: NAD(P)-dependent oxidoreductase [Gammaproteobacteria bacterium]|nr:NAD(P)-dependent oxidoreductase [Gammaproteobacteria bacterium]
MSEHPVGFIGLGNMGRHMANNLAAAGISLSVYDAAGTTERAPPNAHIARDAAHVAATADPIILSLPDGQAVHTVCEQIIASEDTVTHTVVDTSTIGVNAARSVYRLLHDASFDYLDAPVSGGTSGARDATISMMFSGSAASLERLSPILKPLCGNLLHVGTKPGQGQAMKVLNNFLSGTAMAATSEAIAFGETQGLKMNDMLAVLNVSSGRNTATSDKFLNRILTESFDAGFSAGLMQKDVNLYLESARAAGTSDAIGTVVAQMWSEFATPQPDIDFTQIYPHIVAKDAKD